MSDKLILIIPAVTLAAFFLNLFLKGNVSSCLLFILFLLPLMNLKITPEAWGRFKIFDAICFFSLFFFFKDFTTINLKSRNNFYFVLFILLILLALISGLASEFPEKTYLNLARMFPVFIFGRFFILECHKDPSFHLRAIKALKVSYIISLCFLFIQAAVGLKFTFYPDLNPNTGFDIIRYPGIFYDPQIHGQYLAMGSFLFFYIEKGASRKDFLFNGLIFILAIAGMALAGTRAAFGGFAAGLVVVFLMAAKQYRIYGSILIITVLLLYNMGSLKLGIFDRSKNLSEDYLFRQSIWKQAFDITKKHPLLGIGSENYQKYVMRHVQDQYLIMSEGDLMFLEQPENGYLKIMVETGFIGFGIFMLFIIIPLIKGFVFYLKNIYDKRVTFIMAPLISWLVAFNTVYSFQDITILIMVASMIVLIICYPVNEYGYEDD